MTPHGWRGSALDASAATASARLFSTDAISPALDPLAFICASPRAHAFSRGKIALQSSKPIGTDVCSCTIR